MGMCALGLQQADMSALRLLEALLISLPQTLLQTYILLSSDQGLYSPGEWSEEMSIIHATAKLRPRGQFSFFHAALHEVKK